MENKDKSLFYNKNNNISSYTINQSYLNDNYVSIEQRDFIKVEIKDHIIKKEEVIPYNEYICYKIELTCSIKNWDVYRRYNEFKELKEKIVSKNYFVSLPDFPKTSIFNNKDNKTISKRKSMFKVFLNYLVSKLQKQIIPELMDFIKIDKETLILLTKSEKLFSASMSNLNLVDNQLKENFYSNFLDYKQTDSSYKSSNMDVIEQFLKNLSDFSDNKSSVVKTFEEFLRKKWPQFKDDEITKLLFGEYDHTISSYKLKGLLFHSGAIYENLIGSQVCFMFLIRLLQAEYNPESEKFLKVLKSEIRKENLIDMFLSDHLETNKSSIQESVFNFIDLLYDKNKPKLDIILEECNILYPYKNYLKNKDNID